jgi:phosphate starvation-inducible PhoH-like protein
VEAGENLGFLPGDLQQKIDPYLRPLFDALNDTLTPARVQKYMESRIIEVAPLAYMRGRTLNNAFVILDEAQNTTMTQLKMFLTRMGHGARLVVTGDVTQIDLKPPGGSGLVRMAEILRNVNGIGFVYLDHADVVRHPLVQRIIEAFSREESL